MTPSRSVAGNRRSPVTGKTARRMRMQPRTPDNAPVLLTITTRMADRPNTSPAGFRCQIEREHLLPTLALMQAIAESYPALPILSHVFLDARPPSTLEL